MLFFYRIGIWLYGAAARLLSLFSGKARRFVAGRKGLFSAIVDDLKLRKGKLVWVHAASLGEFEQARPLMEAIKDRDPDVEILLTFFSPSGYEHARNYPLADYVHYLPLDTRANAEKFVKTVRPELALFVKYDYWYYHLMALHRAGVPVLVASAIFRRDQLYFRLAGRFFLKAFKPIRIFFLQDRFSGSLLESAGLRNYEVTGDTRFDRVIRVARSDVRNPVIDTFKGEEKVMVMGSIWPDDLKKLEGFIEQRRMDLKFIMAPHDPEERVLSTLDKLEGSIRYSQAGSETVGNHRILILDTMGMLSSIYRYGAFAYVGGGFHGALHNLLEPAAYGLPVFFGRHQANRKFMEADGLIDCGGGFSFGISEELKIKFDDLWDDEKRYLAAAEASRAYVRAGAGASERIVSKLMELL